MSPARQAIQAMTGWLQGADALDLVHRLVHRRLGVHPQDSALSLTLARSFGDDPQSRSEELAQEFLGFLLEHYLPALEKYPDMVNTLLQGRVEPVLHHALQKFTGKLSDRARAKEENPRAYLYRRIRELIAGDPRFRTNPRARHPCFYPADTPRPPDDLAVFPEQHYGDWPPPPNPGDPQQLFTSAYLGRAMELFCSLAVEKQHIRAWIPAREVTAWLTGHFPRLNQYRPEPLDSNTPEPASPARSPDEDAARLAELESIHILAAEFVCGLDEAARHIFHLTLEDPPLPFKEIARRLDFPDHNRPYRIHRKTIAALQQYVRTWPGPPLEELDEEVGLVFLEAVRKICKTSCSRP